MQGRNDTTSYSKSPAQVQQSNTLLVSKLNKVPVAPFSTSSHVWRSKLKDSQNGQNLLASKLVLAWFSQFRLEQGGDPLCDPPRHLGLSAAGAGTGDVDRQGEVGDLQKKIFTGKKYQI